MARILVVEDEAAVRDFVSRALTLHGYGVLVAADGAEAFSLIDEHHFDLLLSDIAMPLMDGISLALKVRAIRPHVPIILMTGYADERQRAHNLSLLIEGLLSKPFNMDQLLRTVNKALKESRAEGGSSMAHSLDNQSGTESRDKSSSSD